MKFIEWQDCVIPVEKFISAQIFKYGYAEMMTLSGAKSTKHHIKVYTKHNFFGVDFEDRESAEKALKELNRKLNGEES